MSDALGYLVTAVELALGLLLVSGVRRREVALASLLLLTVFMISLGAFIGTEEGLGFIAFTAAFAAVSWVLYHQARRAG